MSKYGWPFLLFIGVPFVTRAFASVVAGLYHTVGGSDAASDVFTHFTHLVTGLGSLTSVLVLGALYLRVRNLEQPTLRLVWSCVLVLSVLSAASGFGAYAIGPADSDFGLFWFYSLLALPGLAVVLWFARRASRSSLAHAFFLAVVVGGITLPYLPETSSYTGQVLIELLPDVLAVWLLANFDERGPRFRRVSVGLVIALDGLSYLPLLLFGVFAASVGGPVGIVLLILALGAFVSFILPLVLIYLLRVRQPEGGVRVQ